jgi:hypothetical protein
MAPYRWYPDGTMEPKGIGPTVMFRLEACVYGALGMTDKRIPDTRIAVYKGEPKAVVAVDVSPEGVHFVRSEMLLYGPLSCRVAELFGEGGVAFAPMFEGTGAEDAKRFTYDAVGLSAAHKWIAEYATSRWGKAGCQIIVEDPWLKVADKEKWGTNVRYFGYQDFPYYTAQSGDLFGDIEEATSDPAFLRFGFIVSPPVQLPPRVRAPMREPSRHWRRIPSWPSWLLTMTRVTWCG